MDDLHEEIREFLEAFGLRLNTNLGQHFLVDRAVLDAILDAAAIEDEDHIVEIGPGIGVLTRELLHDARKVTAIELDARMLPVLQKFIGTANREKLTLINRNALLVSMPDEPYKVVANIPYHITSPLIRHVFIESPIKPSAMTLLIQREVAEKICDPAHAGMLTIIVALFGTPSIVTKVPKSAFLPPPKVDSAVLQIIAHPAPLADEETIEKIFRLTKVAFGQKRKMLRNSFGTIPEGLDLLQKAGIDPTRRPETLTIDEWIVLATIQVP